jgi:O-antigen/teichoic acid export membrane protein
MANEVTAPHILPKPELLPPAGLMAFARTVNMLVGLLVIPVLLSALGAEGFGAWALLLAASVAFSTLELGMPATIVKHLSPVVIGNRDEATRIWWHVAVILCCVYALFFPVVWLTADPLAEITRLPDSTTLSAAAMLLVTYIATALRSLLQTGMQNFYAARHFRVVALGYFLQGFLAHVAAMATALATRRIDLTLMVFWATQLMVLATTLAFALTRFPAQRNRQGLDRRLVRALLAHGVRVQATGWAQFANFQFDKFVIAAVSGLAWVAPYEIANRSVVALRSVPTTGMDTFLPAASLAPKVTASWPRYAEMNRLAAWSVLAFMMAPLAVAPLFLAAWTGEIGYQARWLFIVLVAGAAANVLAYPSATIAQATDNAHIQARAALASVAVNLPLSVVLVLAWGPVGGALASAISMGIAGMFLVAQVNRAHGWVLSQTLEGYTQFWPGLAVCGIFALGLAAGMAAWLGMHAPQQHFSRDARLAAAAGAVLAYAACVLCMLEVQLRRTGLSAEERRFATSIVRGKWFAAYCDRHSRASA